MDAHSVKEKLLKMFLITAVVILSCTYVLAHEEEVVSQQANVSEYFKPGDPLTYIVVSIIILIVVFFFMLVVDKKYVNKHKKRFFLTMIIPVILSSLYLAGHTIHENIVSETKGPVHWHADYQVWACGQRLDLVNPQFPSNKIGEPLFHEHNDDRLHVEGTVVDIDDISLGKYFEVIGGELENGHLRYPAVDKNYDFENGDTCSDGSVGTLKVYVNSKRIEDHYNYLYYPSFYVPPGDCVIVLFDSSNSDTTDKICESWTAKDWTYENYNRPEIKIGERTWQ